VRESYHFVIYLKGDFLFLIAHLRGEIRGVSELKGTRKMRQKSKMDDDESLLDARSKKELWTI